MVTETNTTEQELALTKAVLAMADEIGAKMTPRLAISATGLAMFCVGLKATLRAPEWAMAVGQIIEQMPGSPDYFVDWIIEHCPMDSITESQS